MVHRSIGTSPYHLLLGVRSRLKDRPELKELLEKEWISAFHDSRDELRIQAKDNIAKIQYENKRCFDKKRKGAKSYRDRDLVAIKRTQQSLGQKLMHKFLGSYEITKVLRKDRYLVRKVGEQEGPLQTTTSADCMKPWVDKDYPSEDDEDDQDIIRGK